MVIQAPQSQFARSALEGMSIVCDLAAAAREGCRAKKGLKTLIKLRERARDALDGFAPRVNHEELDSPEGVLGLTDFRKAGTSSPSTVPRVQHGEFGVIHDGERGDQVGDTGTSIPPQPQQAFWSFGFDTELATDDLGFNIDDFLNEIQENKLEIVV